MDREGSTTQAARHHPPEKGVDPSMTSGHSAEPPPRAPLPARLPVVRFRFDLSQNTFGSEALLNTFGSEVDFLPNVDKILGKPDRVKSSQLTDFDAE